MYTILFNVIFGTYEDCVQASLKCLLAHDARSIKAVSKLEMSTLSELCDDLSSLTFLIFSRSDGWRVVHSAF